MIKEKIEKLNIICELIDNNNLANIHELRDHIKVHSSEAEMLNMAEVNTLLKSDAELFSLYFDAVYQERKYGRSDFDKETGETK